MVKADFIELGSILHMEKGKKPAAQSNAPKDEYLPYVDIKAFEQGIVDNYATAKKSLLCEDGDLLIVCDGSRSGLTGRAIRGVVGSTLSKIYADGLTTKYLQYFIQSKYLLLNTKKKGTGTPHLNVDILKASTIYVPSRTEQERIVARIEEQFSELNKAVETLQTIKQQLAVYRQAVLKEAFTPREGWRTLYAHQIGIVNLGRQRSPQHVSYHYATKYIRAANITAHGIDLSDVLDMEFSPDEREKYYLIHDDILLSEASGSASQVGKPAIWTFADNEFCFQNTVIRHRVHGEVPDYVFWYYMYLYLSGGFSKMVGGVGINHLGAKNFASIMIPLPSEEQQIETVKAIKSRLCVCDSIEQTVDTALTRAEALRQSILKEAFEGRLV